MNTNVFIDYVKAESALNYSHDLVVQVGVWVQPYCFIAHLLFILLTTKI